MDYNCFVGNWPFYKTRHGSFNDLQRQHREIGINGGYVSSLQSVFYNDPYEAELELAKELYHHEDYHHVMTVNPTLPAWREDLHRGVLDLSIAGVRIIPEFHGYTMQDACVKELVLELTQLKLPLFINLHMIDARVAYLLHPQLVNLSDLKAFLETYQGSVVLCGIRLHEIEMLEDLIIHNKNIRFDVSGLKDKIFIMEELYDKNLCGKMVYGSQAPMLCMNSSKVLIDLANIPDKVKECIYAN